MILAVRIPGWIFIPGFLRYQTNVDCFGVEPQVIGGSQRICFDSF